MSKENGDGPASENLTAAHFAAHRGGAFTVSGAAQRLLLREIREGVGEKKSFRAPFNLIFEGPREKILPEGMVRLLAEDGGFFDLYLMPVHTPDPTRQDYQAAFN